MKVGHVIQTNRETTSQNNPNTRKHCAVSTKSRLSFQVGTRGQRNFKSRRNLGGGGATWVMGIKEGTCDEAWVLYVNDESLNSTPETNIALDIN